MNEKTEKTSRAISTFCTIDVPEAIRLELSTSKKLIIKVGILICIIVILYKIVP